MTTLAREAAQADERVQASAAEARRLSQVLERLPLPIWLRDATLRIDWCNAAYARTVGAEVAEITRAAGIEIETSLNQGQAAALAERSRQAGETQSEVWNFVVDGQRRALEVHEIPGLGEAGLAGLALDVTDREELAAEFKRFIDATSEVMNKLNSAIAMFGPSQRLDFFNQAYARLWRLDEDWLATHPSHGELLDAIRDNRLLPEQADYPAFKVRAMSRYTNLLETEEDFVHRPDGRVLRGLVAPHPLGGLLTVDEDVTDRLSLERSYNTLIAVQKETLDNLFEAVAVFGSDGRLRLHNPAYVRIWELDERLLEGEPHIGDLLDSSREWFDDDVSWQSLREDIVAQVTERSGGGARMERPNGSVLDFAAVPLPDGNMLYTYLDVTDSAQIERALRERNEALETADRLKSEFIANISYELRTPLNVIIGFAEILDNEYFGELNDKQKEYCRGILDSSHHLLALINDVLDLAQIEAGQLELERKSFDVRLMLESVLGLARQRAREAEVTLELECPADIGEAEADERRIRQVLFNLLSNAIKYNGPGGCVTIGVARDRDALSLWVADDGIGIDAPDREYVFERFRRGSQTGRSRGAGLGLSVVKNFVELHGGRVELDSEADRGTRVTVRLPQDGAEGAPDLSDQSK